MRVKKKRLDKFKQHTTNILKPYVEKAFNNEEISLYRLSKAVDGILYQYIGNEDEFLDTNEDKRQFKIDSLAETIQEYHNMGDEEKQLLSELCEGVVDGRKVLNAHITQLIFRTINKQSPTFFFYKDKLVQNPPEDSSEKPSKE